VPGALIGATAGAGVIPAGTGVGAGDGVVAVGAGEAGVGASVSALDGDGAVGAPRGRRSGPGHPITTTLGSTRIVRRPAWRIRILRNRNPIYVGCGDSRLRLSTERSSACC
jgi:hypothetical protein